MANALPHILVLGPPSIFRHFQSQYSHSYNFLCFFASSLPPPHFLSSLNIHPSSVHAILCNPFQPVPADLISSLPRPHRHHQHRHRPIDTAECRRFGVRVAIAGRVYTEDVADLAVGLLIDVLMRISAADRCVRKLHRPEEPRNIPSASRVGGKRVGIAGLGKIGMEVAKRLQPFGCKIMYNSRTKKTCVAYPFYGSAVELAANSDVLVLCCALTEETHHIGDARVMEALGKEGVIVNVGRGGLIDEKELVRRLVNGQIGGAGLDVFENEPRVPTEALWITLCFPHMLPEKPLESFNQISDLVAANLRAFFEDKPLLTPVMPD